MAKRSPKWSNTKSIHWESIRLVTHFSGAQARGLTLMIIVMRENFGTSPGWGALALVTSDKVGTLDGVLDDHDHKILARSVSFAQAKRAAADAIRVFLAKKAKRNHCECKEAKGIAA
jgi:hypothetical protein